MTRDRFVLLAAVDARQHGDVEDIFVVPSAQYLAASVVREAILSDDPRPDVSDLLDALWRIAMQQPSRGLT
jgi:hypothetical protein